MEFRATLFKYTYYTYCQGTKDQNESYALVYAPVNSSPNNKRSVLMNDRHIEGVYEIDIESVEDMTIDWWGSFRLMSN